MHISNAGVLIFSITAELFLVSPFLTLEQHTTFKESMINRLSNLINRKHSTAKISQVLCFSSIFPSIIEYALQSWVHNYINLVYWLYVTVIVHDNVPSSFPISHTQWIRRWRAARDGGRYRDLRELYSWRPSMHPAFGTRFSARIKFKEFPLLGFDQSHNKDNF